MKTDTERRRNQINTDNNANKTNALVVASVKSLQTIQSYHSRGREVWWISRSVDIEVAIWEE